MRKILMASVALSLCGSALAQSATPAYQDSRSQAQQNAGASQANAELFYMLEQLQREVRQLRGELEEQRNQLDRLSQQSRSRYIDLDQRILGLNEKISEPGPGEAAAAASDVDVPAASRPEPRDYRAPSAEEQQAYQQIQSLIREQKDYDAAIGKLYDFIGQYPEGDLTVNAYYWLGEVYLVKPQLEQAKQAFTIVASRFADHRKAPDAAYKLGITLDKMGDAEEARQQMDAVIRSYPESGAAELARKFLATE
ncbi:tol-pal system protein YbgF [Marinobacter zhejiangensis]|uniref:Cell division coordinator CpoB n=1 Tax=Marinobacter zhejiangensis TaxID=488535 RepID=A0A1I4RKV5_9GAMM|nr:tol-pal system protein YbgF [Marinobacter zhejiangensis]SFM52859.1 tol-pal system protein YbgF [Marinobacter zhejiangensis]